MVLLVPEHSPRSEAESGIPMLDALPPVTPAASRCDPPRGPLVGAPRPVGSPSRRRALVAALSDDSGAATAEYAITIMATVARRTILLRGAER